MTGFAAFFLRELGTPLDTVGGGETRHYIQGGRDAAIVVRFPEPVNKNETVGSRD